MSSEYVWITPDSEPEIAVEELGSPETIADNIAQTLVDNYGAGAYIATARAFNHEPITFKRGEHTKLWAHQGSNEAFDEGLAALVLSKIPEKLAHKRALQRKFQQDFATPGKHGKFSVEVQHGQTLFGKPREYDKVTLRLDEPLRGTKAQLEQYSPYKDKKVMRRKGQVFKKYLHSHSGNTNPTNGK